MTNTNTSASPTAVLWAEFLFLFVAAPVVMAVILPPHMMFPMLFTIAALGVLLLWRTPGVGWRDLGQGAGAINWGLVGLFSLGTALICYGVIRSFAPEAMFRLIRIDPWLLLMILTLYPILSALPQELIYRLLFFRRYAALMPSANGAVVLNAALFSLAHLMYWNVIVSVMTFGGGLIFAKTYARGGNFPQVVLLHAIAGNLIFVFGLGIYFYSGNVTRPF